MDYITVFGMIASVLAVFALVETGLLSISSSLMMKDIEKTENGRSNPSFFFAIMFQLKKTSEVL